MKKIVAISVGVLLLIAIGLFSAMQLVLWRVDDHLHTSACLTPDSSDVGGVVIDNHDQPIANADVFISNLSPQYSICDVEYVRELHLTTDSEGKFRSGLMLHTMQEVMLTIRASGCQLYQETGFPFSFGANTFQLQCGGV